MTDHRRSIPPQACDEQTPCEQTISTCSSGVAVAGASPSYAAALSLPFMYSYTCPLSTPDGAFENGAGCGVHLSCKPCCGCRALWASGNPIPPPTTTTTTNSPPRARRQYCYISEVQCEAGPNLCVASLGQSCRQSPSTCGTGRAAGSGAIWTCASDSPAGSAPSSSGRLCYDTISNCYAGNNVRRPPPPTPPAHRCLARGGCAPPPLAATTHPSAR